jgi:hypothetical protein
MMATTSFQVESIIRRSNRNLLTACLIGLAVVVIGGAISLSYYYNFFSGPFPMTVDQLAALPNLDGVRQYYVTLNPPPEAVINTGYQDETNSSISHVVNAYYYGLRLGDRIMLIRLGSQGMTPPFTGVLVAVPPDLHTLMAKDSPSIAGRLTPFMLATGDFRTPGYTGLVVGPIILILTVLGLIRLLKRYRHPEEHPALRSLKGADNPMQQVEQIDSELSAEHAVMGSLHVTPHWIVQTSSGSFRATPIKDVIWFYTHINSYGSNTGAVLKTTQFIIHDRRGNRTIVSGSPVQVGVIQTLLKSRAPFAFSGYDPGTENLWHTNRPALIAVVDGRRGDSRI